MPSYPPEGERCLRYPLYKGAWIILNSMGTKPLNIEIVILNAGFYTNVNACSCIVLTRTGAFLVTNVTLEVTADIFYLYWFYCILITVKEGRT